MIPLAKIAQNWGKELNKRRVGHGIKTAGSWMLWHFGYDIPTGIYRSKSCKDGTCLFEFEWDVLIVLDACRVDLVDCVDSDYDWIDDYGSIKSVGGDSYTWMKNTFSEEHAEKINNTAYVTANPHSEKVFNRHNSIDISDFQVLRELWKSEWNSNIGTVEPGVVSDHGITIKRNKDPQRLILHYMQPHFPSIPDPMGSNINLDNISWDWSVWEQLKQGEVTSNKVWEAYENNLRYVLGSVDIILHNIDAEHVLVTSDHGNALGERGYFGHGNYPVPAVTNVPIIRTSAENTAGYSPEINAESGEVNDQDTRDRLRALGYK